ncbi:radical SAM protein [candidate division WOR-3 bacterium]|nr:radical SAM protein [candidate division WOR-3 bacterium]
MTISVATKKEKKEFFKTIIKRAEKKRNPFSIMFELTYRCNFRCPHCYIQGSHKDKKELNTKKIFSILDQLKDMEVYNIGFTGGEPLIREDIFDILSYGNRCGFKFDILSNGYLIDERIADRLGEVNVNKVDITFNAITPQVFDQITQIKGSFKRVKKAIDILKEKGIQTAIKSTCMQINKDEITEVSRFARNLGILYTIDGEILPCRNGCATWVNRYSIDSREYEDLRRKVYPEMFRDEGKRVKTKSRRRRDRMFYCGVGITSFSIDPYGKMNFCLEIDYPRCNILSEGVKTCWEKLKKEVDRLNKTKDFVCRDCDLLKDCGWCPGRSFIETGSFNNCSEYFRKRALERSKEERYG